MNTHKGRLTYLASAILSLALAPILPVLAAGPANIIWKAADNAAPVVGLSYSGDGLMLATAGHDGLVQCYSTESGGKLYDMEMDHAATSVAMSADGLMLAAGALDKEGGIYVQYIGKYESEPIELEGHLGGTMAVKFTPDGQYLVSGGCDGTVKVWETTSWRLVNTLAFADAKTAPDAQVMSIDIDNKGTMIAAGGINGPTRVYNLAKLGKPIRSYVAGYPIRFAPDGSSLAIVPGNGTILLFPLARLNGIQVFEGADNVESIDFAPSGQMLMAGGYRVTLNYKAPTVGVLHFWNVATTEMTETYDEGTDEAVMAVRFNMTGSEFSFSTTLPIVYTALSPKGW